jgi:Fructose-2,6-bisphosphatase
MRLIIVRHGETTWNEKRILQGVSETELTPRGIWQAECIAARLEPMQIDGVISSSLRRALDTAKAIATLGKFNLQTDAVLREMDFGAWEGKTFEEISKLYPEQFLRWRKAPDQHRVSEKAERIDEVWLRLQPLLQRLQEENEEACYVLVTHTIPAKLMIAASMGLPFDRIHSLRLENASMSIADWNKERNVLCLMNDVSHLKER